MWANTGGGLRSAARSCCCLNFAPWRLCVRLSFFPHVCSQGLPADGPSAFEFGVDVLLRHAGHELFERVAAGDHLFEPCGTRSSSPCRSMVTRQLAKSLGSVRRALPSVTAVNSFRMAVSKSLLASHRRPPHLPSDPLTRKTAYPAGRKESHSSPAALAGLAALPARAVRMPWVRAAKELHSRRQNIGQLSKSDGRESHDRLRGKDAGGGIREELVEPAVTDF